MLELESAMLEPAMLESVMLNQDRPRVDSESIQDRSKIDPGSTLDRSAVDPGSFHDRSQEPPKPRSLPHPPQGTYSRIARWVELAFADLPVLN